jgi:hypothetical protein
MRVFQGGYESEDADRQLGGVCERTNDRVTGFYEIRPRGWHGSRHGMKEEIKVIEAVRGPARNKTPEAVLLAILGD